MAGDSKVVFLGTSGPLALGALRGLLRGGAHLDAVICVGEPDSSPPQKLGDIQVRTHDDLVTVADDATLPVAPTYGSADRDVRRALTNAGASVVVCACLAAILSPETLRAPRHGIWNIHPSTLPRFRGPAPMFWQLRAGLSIAGVSVHKMTQTIDSGPLWGRAPVQLPAGIGELQAEYLAGEVGGRLAATLLRTPHVERHRQPVTCLNDSYQSHPTPADFSLLPEWSAERALRFVRATRWRRQPYTYCQSENFWRIHDAVGVRDVELREPKSVRGQLLLPFADRALVTRGQQGREP